MKSKTSVDMTADEIKKILSADEVDTILTENLRDQLLKAFGYLTQDWVLERDERETLRSLSNIDAHRWLCHPETACEDGCDAAADPIRLARYQAAHGGEHFTRVVDTLHSQPESLTTCSAKTEE